MVSIEKRFNINKYFYSYLDIIKDIFLEYYDEEYHDKINEAFANFTFIGYLSPAAISNHIFYLENSISKKLINQFIQEFNFTNDPDFRIKAFFYGFENKDECPLYKIMTRQDNYEEELKYIFNLNSESPDYETLKQKYLTLVDSTYDTFLKYQRMYDEEIKPYEEYINYAESLSQLEKNSQPVYINKFIRRSFFLLSKEDKEFYLTHQQEFYNPELAASYFRKMQCYTNLVSRYSEYMNFQYEGYIDAFSKENEEKLTTPNDRKIIEKRRINYFKNLGIDLGDNYETYLTNPDVKLLWPSEEDITRINQIKKDIYEETIRDYLLTIPMYQEIKNLLDNSGFTTKGMAPFIFDNYLKDNWNVSPNYILKNDRVNYNEIKDSFSLHPIILFSANDDSYYIDCHLMHELNHVVEYIIKSINITRNDDNTVTITVTAETGLNCKMEEETIKELGTTKYELFCEAINEIIAINLTNLMHSKGIYLYREENEYETNVKTLYVFAIPLVEEYYKTFKGPITYARMTGNREYLFNIIGEENYEELNNLVNEFYIYFKILSNSNLINDTLKQIDDGIINDNTEIYNSFINRSNNILSKMKKNATKDIKLRKLNM